MEAKDTVIAIRKSVELPDDHSLLSMISFADHVAEISFKAGVREVVGWVDDTDIMVMLSPRQRRDWQSKLKKWGIDIGN